MTHRLTPRLSGLRRRHWLLAAALPALAPALSWAQGPAAPIAALGVFSLLGDGLQITLPSDVTDSRLDRNLRESLPTKGIGFDQEALRVVTDFMSRQRPAAKMQMFRATTPMSLPDQRTLADGATRAELPSWIVQAIQQANLSHLLLITRHRGDAAFPVSDGFTLGKGMVEGIGFYLDAVSEVKNVQTGMNSQGFLGAYAMIRVQLMEVASGNIIGSQDIREGRTYAGRIDTEAANVWNALSPTEKVEALRGLVKDGMSRVLPMVMARA